MGSHKTLFIVICFHNSCYNLHYFDKDDICSKGPGQALFDSCSPSTVHERGGMHNQCPRLSLIG